MWSAIFAQKYHFCIIRPVFHTNIIISGNHGYSGATESDKSPLSTGCFNFPLLITEAVNSSARRSMPHFLWYRYSMQLLQAVSCKFGQQCTNTWQFFEEQVPCYTVRTHRKGKWVHLLFKTTTVRRVYDIDLEARINFVNWPLLGVYGVEMTSTPILFSDKDWFKLSGYGNSHYSRYWFAENPLSIHEVPLNGH